MKTPTKLALCSVAAFSLAQAAGATDISFFDSSANTVEIVANDLPAGQAVTGYDVLISFDAGVSDIASINFNDTTIFGVDGGFDTTNQGTIGFGGGSFTGPFTNPLELNVSSLDSDASALAAQASLPAEGIVLATLTLDPSGGGASSTDLSVNWTTGGYEVTGVGTDPTTGLPPILGPTVAAVPEPATLSILGLGLLGLGISRRRRSV